MNQEQARAAVCAFCEIVERDDPDTREVYRDSDAIAFFPTEPAVLGHTMIIPRRHVPDIWSLDEALAQRLSVLCVQIAHVMRVVLHPDGLNIIQSNGEAASQTVMHLHVHLVPRWSGDRMGDIWPKESDYSEDQKDEIWTDLRRGFQTLRGGMRSPAPASTTQPR